MDPDSASALVFSVFRTSWIDFSHWKKHHVSTTLDSLQRQPTSLDSISDSDSDDDDDDDDDDSESTDSGPRWEVTLYNSDKEQTENYRLPISTIEVDATKPHPRYTSCPPAARNVIVGDDSHCMPFIPYEDDLTFDHEAQMEHYDYFQWQNMPDPDVEVIAVQAVKVLTRSYQLTLPEIIATNIMPPSIITHLTSLLGARRRDYPPWPPYDPLHPTNVPYIPDYTNASPVEILDRLLQYFCTTNCHHGYCAVHTGELPLPPAAVPPTPTSETKQKSTEKTCSKNCFLLGQQQHPGPIPLWEAEDIGFLHATLKYGPGSLACDLAVILRKPCNEVEGHRKRWLALQGPPPLSSSNSYSNKNACAGKSEFEDFDFDNFTPNYPCSHLGPCDASNTNCPCFENGAHCIGACKCSKKCAIKWRGCSCSRLAESEVKSNATTSTMNTTMNTMNTMNTTSRTCGTIRCPCFRAHRECDPELCLRCDARSSNREGSCRNSAIQHMRHKRGVIFRSRYGLGFYLSESVREGDLITEYIGDLIYEATTKSRDPIASHSRRQYMFKLNSTLTVDGGAIGNESRYINHASGDQANVQAHVRLVNGEHRIGIFAGRDIGAGEEVFLDYGTEFFQTRKKVVVE